MTNVKLKAFLEKNESRIAVSDDAITSGRFNQHQDLPLVSIPANVLAVPVAGFVMLYGLPAALVAGWVPVLAGVVMFPARLGVRWVDTVAVIGERVEPHGRAVWIGWSVVVAAVVTIAAKNRLRHGRLPPHG